MKYYLQCLIFGCSASIIAWSTLLTDPVPLTEYYSRTLKGYTPLKWDTITPDIAAGMLRVRDLSDADFQDLVRRGYPFIVEDCAPEAPLRDVPCSEFGRRWPKEHMRAEYTPGQEHIFLQDPTWYSEQKPTATARKHLSRGKPLSGPYIWHVKDETEDRRTKPTIQDMFTVPYFLNRTTLNAKEALDSFEFWFVLENGGSQAHADAYCETTISLQLRGQKKWRLGAFPNITNAFQPYAFHDAEIYRHDKFWQPESEELVIPGQCVVFPMGYIHETYVGEGDGGEDGCSVATTFQFQDPQPVHLWKNFLARWGLSHYARDEPCLKRMEPYVYFGKRLSSSSDEARTRESARKVFQSLDANGDGSITEDELGKQMKTEQRFPWTEVRSQHDLKQAAKEKREFVIADAILYHDSDADGLVSWQEFEESVLKFSAVMRRLGNIKRTRNRPQLMELEREWIRNHMCTSDDCSYLKQLEKDFEGKTKKKPKSEL